VREDKICISNMKLTPDLSQEIGEAQRKDDDFQTFKSKMLEEENFGFKDGENGMLYISDRVCMLNNGDLKKQILGEAHKSRYAIHPGEVKMYQNLKKVYWWPGVKKDVVQYISTCLTYQKAKVGHKKPAGLLQP
jgi:hypothetical protein